MRKRVLFVVAGLILLGGGSLISYRAIFLHFIRVPTGSMANTIIPGDYLVVKKRGFGEIERGDLIVFRYPDDSSTYYLSRVVGLPRETIHVRGRIIYVNGRELNEQRVMVKPGEPRYDPLEELSTEGSGRYRVFYQAASQFSPDGEFAVNEPFQIPDNRFFVMGDNRDNSHDSRYRGPVSRDAIFGKPKMIYWSERGDSGGQIRWDRMLNSVE